ncbi:bactofilin family protein [Caulobacter sp.]|uniref:bactofilin family protein n=1 Tax=Caulobacter sp. TaxID=78 RepID=UPI003BA8A85D
MFTKTKNTPAPAALTLEPPRAPTPAPAPRPKPASMIAQGVTIKGDVVGDGELHLDCVVLGDIRVGKLILGPNSRVEGSVTAQVIEIHGNVLGSITAQAVRLYGTAKVDGDITHEQLAMESGAEFQGRSLKFQRQAPTPAAAPAPVPPMPQSAPAPVTQG